VVPLIALTLTFWSLLLGMVFWVQPQIIKDFLLPNSYLIFFVIFFLAWFFLLTLVINNTRRGLIYGLGVLMIAILKVMRLGNIINLVLLAGVMMMVDFYLLNR